MPEYVTDFSDVALDDNQLWVSGLHSKLSDLYSRIAELHAIGSDRTLQDRMEITHLQERAAQIERTLITA